MGNIRIINRSENDAWRNLIKEREAENGEKW